MTVSESLGKAVEEFLEKTPEMANHTSDFENPHQVSKSQVGLGNLTNEKQATEAEFSSHKSDTENPHSVTKEQVGLGEVKNEKQATAAEFESHLSGEGGQHSAADIVYTEGVSVLDKMGEFEKFEGTLNHSELENRDSEGAHPISAIVGLSDKMAELDSVQAGVETISADIAEIESKIEALESNIVDNESIIKAVKYTTDATEVELALSGNGNYLYNGWLSPFSEYSAVYEVSVVAAVVENGFPATVMNAKADVVCGNCGGECRSYCSNVEYSWAPEAPDETFGISLKQEYEGVAIAVKGLDGVKISWRACVRIKNYTWTGGA